MSSIRSADAQANAQQVQVDYADLEMSLRSDGEMFINFFLYEELTYQVPQFHLDCWGWLTNDEILRIVLALPRNHAKTTLAKLAVVRYFIFTDVRFIVYVSNTASIAKDACRDIINFLECENFITVFGPCVFTKRSEGDGIYIFTFRGKTCILRSLGAGQQVRGLNIDNRRPQMYVVDDLEDEENTGTDAQKAKLARWIYGPFLKALDKVWNKVIWLGNMIAPDCQLAKLCESPMWHSKLYGSILANGQPLWPDMFPLEDLIAEFKEYQRNGQAATWFCEMMNMPIAAGTGLVNPDEIKYHPQRWPDDVECGGLTIDPALGATAGSDWVGIVAHGLVDGNPEQLDYAWDHMNPTETAEKALEMCFKWGFTVIGIENAAYQMALGVIIELICISRRIDNITVVPLRGGNTKKTARLQAFWSLNTAGEFDICENATDIVAQALVYNILKKENKDDLIDATAYGPQLMQQYTGLMKAHKDTRTPSKVQEGTRVSAV